jgi:hypothetical protein
VVFWAVTLCYVVDGYKCLTGTCALHLQVQSEDTVKIYGQVARKMAKSLRERRENLIQANRGCEQKI